MILLLTPLKLEHEAFGAALGRPQRRVDYDGVEAVIHGESLTTAVGGHGKVQFALTTSFLAERVAPKLVICAGACGGLSPVVRPGDVVVATETLEHDFNLRFVVKPQPVFSGDSAILSLLQSRPRPVASAAEFNVHFGRIASGDEDVIEASRGSEILAATDALAVAWEGAGGARASRFQKLPFIEIRGVTDMAGSGAAEFAKNLERAMENIAAVLLPLLPYA